MSITVVLADNHPIVREGLRSIIAGNKFGIEITGEASDGYEVLKIARENPADVYILDISMPNLNGLETTERLIEQNPSTKIIILSIHDSRIFVERALKSGARGYILKDDATEKIPQAITDVYRGKYYLSPGVSKFVVHGFLAKLRGYAKHKEIVKLTKREKEILQLISEGSTNKETAQRLNISLNTVHVHRNNIMRKLDIHNQAELIRYAIKEGITKI
jgi:DNA-binding NarL/FixJ family response regulator